MATIPHAALDKRQLPLLPDAVALRCDLAIRQQERIEKRLLGTADNATVLAHVSAILSPYRVEAMAQEAITRAYLAADTEEEAEDHFLTWLDEIGRAYLTDWSDETLT